MKKNLRQLYHQVCPRHLILCQSSHVLYHHPLLVQLRRLYHRSKMKLIASAHPLYLHIKRVWNLLDKACVNWGRKLHTYVINLNAPVKEKNFYVINCLISRGKKKMNWYPLVRIMIGLVIHIRKGENSLHMKMLIFLPTSTEYLNRIWIYFL